MTPRMTTAEALHSSLFILTVAAIRGGRALSDLALVMLGLDVQAVRVAVKAGK